MELRIKELERRKRIKAKKKNADGKSKTKTDKAVPKKLEKTVKQTKALSRLEEDFKAGNLDKDIYEELKEKYLESDMK